MLSKAREKGRNEKYTYKNKKKKQLKITKEKRQGIK